MFVHFLKSIIEIHNTLNGNEEGGIKNDHSISIGSKMKRLQDMHFPFSLQYCSQITFFFFSNLDKMGGKYSTQMFFKNISSASSDSKNIYQRKYDTRNMNHPYSSTISLTNYS